MSIFVFQVKNQRQTWRVMLPPPPPSPPPPKNSCRGHFLFANDTKCAQVDHVKFSLPLNGQLGWKGQIFLPAPPPSPFPSVLCQREKLLGHDRQTLQIMSLSVRRGLHS